MKLIMKYINSSIPKRERVAPKKSNSLSGLLFLTCLIFSLFATSCNKFLDVQPEGQLTGDQLLKDAEGFETAMYGVYATMGTKQLYGENLSHNMLEILAQYFDCQNTFVDNLKVYNYKFSSVEAVLSDIWTKAYNNIANVNNVIKNLERFSPENLKHYNIYKGEALGLRAFMHFDLLRVYTENIKLNAAASGIPYSANFKLEAPPFIPLADVYTKIIADLTEAEQLLSADQQYISFPKSNNSDNYLKDREIHFNLYAVQATLARVYLTKGDLPNALIYAEKVIGSNKYQLLDKTDLNAGIMKGVLFPKENIFGLYSTNYFATVRDRFTLQTSKYNYDNRSNLKATYEAGNVQGGNDVRWSSFFRELTAPKSVLTKLVDPYQENNLEFQRPAGRIKGINLIRLPEMYYIAAEALLNTDPEKARTYFDAVLKSRGIIALKDRSPAVTLTLDLITADRYKEFIGEGQTFFNMKRLNSNIINTLQQVVPASKAIYVLPIPLIEFDYRK